MKKIEVDGLQIDLSEYSLHAEPGGGVTVNHLATNSRVGSDCGYQWDWAEDMQEAMDWIIGHQLERHGIK